MAYIGNSIVDYLKSIGQDSSYSSRKKLADQYGIANYTGTGDQNLKLLDLVRNQSSQDNSTASNADVSSNTAETADSNWLQNDPDFKSLPKDMQDYIVAYNEILTTSDKESQEVLVKALDEAGLQADPYFKEIITVAKDELTRNLGGQQADFDTQEKTLTTNIERIKEDLATKRNDLTIDQQADLSKQLRSYEQDLSSLRENAAAGGLTFSSKRAAAEKFLNEENNSIIESTKTKYMREIRDLETAAARGEKDALSQIDDYKRQLGENMTQSLRTVESKLGTANLPDYSQYAERAKALGGVTGTLEEDKTKDILNRANALMDLNKL